MKKSFLTLVLGTYFSTLLFSQNNAFDVRVNLGSPVGDYPLNWRFVGLLEKIVVNINN